MKKKVLVAKGSKASVGGIRPGEVGIKPQKGQKLSGFDKKVLKTLDKTSEWKYKDSGVSFTQIDRSGLLTIFTMPTQGDGVNQREGDSISLKRVGIRLNAYLNDTLAAVHPQHAIRVIVGRLMWDTTVVTYSVGSILTLGATVLDVNAFYNEDVLAQGGFEIWFDKTWSIGDGSEGVVLVKNFDLNTEIEFSAAATTGAGIPFVLQIGDDVNGAHTPDVQSQFYARMWYHDS
jgi:hypothetical protein